MKAISSQNECGSAIGLALISIHLACLCVEPAGAAAGGLGGKEVCVCVRVWMDCTGDVAKHLTDGSKWRERRGVSQRGEVGGGIEAESKPAEI